MDPADPTQPALIRVPSVSPPPPPPNDEVPPPSPPAAPTQWQSACTPGWPKTGGGFSASQTGSSNWSMTRSAGWGRAPADTPDSPPHPVSTALQEDALLSAHRASPQDAPREALLASPPLLALLAHAKRGVEDEHVWDQAACLDLQVGTLIQVSRVRQRLTEAYSSLGTSSARFTDHAGRLLLTVNSMTERFRTHMEQGYLDPDGLQIPVRLDSPAPNLPRPILTCRLPDDNAAADFILGMGPLKAWLEGHGLLPYSHYFPRPLPILSPSRPEVLCEVACTDDTLDFLGLVQTRDFRFEGPEGYTVVADQAGPSPTSQISWASRSSGFLDDAFFPPPYQRYSRVRARPPGFLGSINYLLIVNFPSTVSQYGAKLLMRQHIPVSINFSLGLAEGRPRGRGSPSLGGGLLFASDADRGLAGRALRNQPDLRTMQGFSLEYPIRELNPPPRDGCYRCGEPGHRKEQCPNAQVFRCGFCGQGGHGTRACPSVPHIDTLLERSIATAPAPEPTPMVQASRRVHERVGDRERVIEEQVVHVGQLGHPSPGHSLIPAPSADPEVRQLSTRVSQMEDMLRLILDRLPARAATITPGPDPVHAQDETTPVPAILDGPAV